MSLRNEGTSAIAWSLTEKFLKRGVQFILSIFLARLLTPSDFGVVAMATIFVSWAEVFKDFGMGQAIIQKKDVTEAQVSTVFWINLMMGILIAIIFVLIAPWAARFYENDMVAWVVRVAGLTFILTSLNVVQSSLFVKALNYKVGTIASLLASTLSGMLGILMAYIGFGIWSLLAQSVMSTVITTAYLWLKSKWRPKRVFNFKETQPLFAKGVGFMGQGLISEVSASIDSMVIGKMYSPASLGLFSRGKSFASMLETTLFAPISRPLFPIFAKINGDTPRMNSSYLKIMRMLTWTASLICGLFIIMSYEIIYILYGTQWIDAAQYLLFFSIIIPFNAINSCINSIWKGMGETKLLVKVSLITRIIYLLSLVGLFFGIRSYAIMNVITVLINIIIKTLYHKHLTGVGLCEQYKELFMESAIIAIVFILFLFMKIDSVYISALIKTTVFIVIYLLGSVLLKIEGMKVLLRELKANLVMPKK